MNTEYQQTSLKNVSTLLHFVQGLLLVKNHLKQLKKKQKEKTTKGSKMLQIMLPP